MLSSVPTLSCGLTFVSFCDDLGAVQCFANFVDQRDLILDCGHRAASKYFEYPLIMASGIPIIAGTSSRASCVQTL
jgi:hypothetical protein